MKTPAGKECRYFYGDYRRGRNHEECRLLEDATPRQVWAPDLCRTCPVPEILMANACPNMILEGKVKRGFIGIGRGVQVTAYCTLSKTIVAEPEVGCGQCHPLPFAFTESEHDPHPPA
ncbi:MAG: hypothetical protein PHQ40_20575 [Anaerolineaceae bacterium]|nr:hypothetical protein [Anaerolineaceae bacterium]